MAQAKIGDTVQIHYSGRLDDGTLFDSSEGRDPLEFTLGTGQVIPGFENGVLGMGPGETRTIRIVPEDGYGPRHADRILVVERNRFPSDQRFAPGMMLQATQPDGSTLQLRIVGISADSVTLDANHPLAGQTLTFDLQLVGIV